VSEGLKANKKGGFTVLKRRTAVAAAAAVGGPLEREGGVEYVIRQK
jgi:hypothetical protein